MRRALILSLVLAATAAQASDGLPLKRGFYVRAEAATCAAADEATLLILRREGIGGASDFCKFLSIEPAGANTYTVKQNCAHISDPNAGEDDIVTYTLKGDAAFTVTSSHGWSYSARLCPQADLPAPWNDTDISDLVK